MAQQKKRIDINVHRVEYLAGSPGMNEFGPAVVLTIRPNSNFRSHNIALSAEQADRLRRDLNRMFKDSMILKPKR